MELLDEVLRWIQTIGFVGIALWALLRWRRQRDDQSRWLAATFAAIGLTVLLDVVGELFVSDEPPLWLARIVIAALVLFPYLLLRFLHTFEPVPTGFRRTMGWFVLAQAAYVLVVPAPDPDATGPMPLAIVVFFVVVLLAWLTTLPYVGWRFWRAGADRPTLARRRLRLLSVAVVTLSVAILLAGIGGEEATGALVVTTQLVTVASAGLFIVGFVTPRILRRQWGQHEERRLHSAAIGLMATTTTREVADVLLPHLRRVVSARAVALIDGGELLGWEGLSDDEQRAVVEGGSDGARRAELSNGVLLVWTDRYSPFFGENEHELLERAGLLADLALHRARLLASEQEARRSLQETNAELESFVYSASHDLKSPLIAMLSYIDILRSEHLEALGEEAGWYLERMATNGEYMESLIRDLLELSRVGRMQTQTDRVELAAVLEELVTELRAQHPTFTATIDPMPVIAMNGVRARQLFANLLENAAKHSAGEPVHVAVRASTARNGEVVISVRDDGPGIPEPYRERVFGVFERLEVDDHTGTGIGLAICRKIMETIGGRIRLADREDGAEFLLQLPADVVAERPAQPEGVPA